MKRQVRSLDSVARLARCIDHYYFRTTCKLVCGTVRDDLWTDIVLQISSREYISPISESLVTGTILLQIRRWVFRERNENSILSMGLRSISSMVGFAAIRRRALSLQRVLREISSCHFNPFVFRPFVVATDAFAFFRIPDSDSLAASTRAGIEGENEKTRREGGNSDNTIREMRSLEAGTEQLIVSQPID